jgi:hypothetical protein
VRVARRAIRRVFVAEQEFFAADLRRILAFLDPLLGRTPLIVKAHHGPA